METGRISVSREQFRSPLIPLAAAVSLVGTLCGLGAVVLLFFPATWKK